MSMSYKDICIEYHGYYFISDNELSEYVLKDVQNLYPKAILIKVGKLQYIVVSENGQENLIEKFECDKKNLNKCLLELNCTTDKLKSISFD